VLPLHVDWPAGRPLSVLTIGAHADDIEIGAGGTHAEAFTCTKSVIVPLASPTLEEVTA
jgi:LmbE family N-acetylglucosaminyl deacetylase